MLAETARRGPGMARDYPRAYSDLCFNQSISFILMTGPRVGGRNPSLMIINLYQRAALPDSEEVLGASGQRCTVCVSP
ncbi:1-deoxyxylulose-5-phosphate synthase [Anopheles sinensis]|uniref:1-deoxyxylulose-5-phosphate synthase n=1 Tax=Anopheles sinensis TaxID=74873 RepID=A0A084WDD4_ANOSI|nr:1-deoxyxylulose-5-phosphate synthase [Anopheles sinensis]